MSLTNSKIWPLLERMRNHPEEFSYDSEWLEHKPTDQKYALTGKARLYNRGGPDVQFSFLDRMRFESAVDRLIAWHKKTKAGTQEKLLENAMGRLIGVGFGDEDAEPVNAKASNGTVSSAQITVSQQQLNAQVSAMMQAQAQQARLSGSAGLYGGGLLENQVSQPGQCVGFDSTGQMIFK